MSDALLTTRIEELEAVNTEFLQAAENLLTIIGDSTGIAGWRRNGNEAEWDEFEEVDQLHDIIRMLWKKLRVFPTRRERDARRVIRDLSGMLERSEDMEDSLRRMFVERVTGFRNELAGKYLEHHPDKEEIF